MDMNKSFVLRNEDRNPQWRVLDAKGQVLGRLATQIADALRGKDQPTFTPHIDSGDYIVVINAKEIVLTGNKWNQKEYITHSGWMSGRKVRLAKDWLAKDPAHIIHQAVKNMLPKNRLSRTLLKKLKVYAGAEHKHTAQVKASQAA